MNAKMKQQHTPRGPARREALKLLGGALAFIGCGPDLMSSADGGTDGGTSGTDGGATVADAGTTPTTCTVADTETLGPYPDKVGMLTNTTYHRQDITEGRPGLPLTVVLSVVNTNSACAAITNAQVIVWQCDAAGHYSEYTQMGYDGTGLTYLRGVQTTDANGQVTFKSIYPGWYQGRATHIHIEVYVNGASKKVTQLAFPESVNAAVYATGVYASKGQSPQSNATDMVFSDSLPEELANLTGDTTNGYTATLTVGIPL